MRLDQVALRTGEDSGTRWRNEVVAATVAAGASVALAPILPRSLVVPLLILALVAWVITSAGFAVATLREQASQCVTGQERIIAVVGLLSLLLAIFGAIQLEIVRWFWNMPEMTWNIDWRYSLSHAQAISRTGGLDETLDYAGAPLLYHVGPAWLAAAFHRVSGFGIEVVLFGLIPLVSTVSIVAGLTLLLGSLGTPPRVAILAVATAMLAPNLNVPPLDFLRWPGLLLDPEARSGVGLMLNSYFALAVGCCALALLVAPGQNRFRLLIGSLGLASVLAIKPQFFVSMGLLAGLIGAARASDLVFRKRRAAATRAGIPAATWLVISGALILMPLSFAWHRGQAQVEAFIGPMTMLMLLMLSRPTVTEAPGVRPVDLLLAAALSLCLAVWLMLIGPHVPSPFGPPSWAPGATGWSQHEYLSLATVMFVAAVFARASARLSAVGHIAGTFSLAWFTLLATTLVSAAMHFVSFPLRADLMAQGLAFGGFQIGENSQQFNLAQSEIPLRILLAAASIAMIADWAINTATFWKTGFAAVIAAVSIVYAVSLIPQFMHPERGYEAAADRDLREVLAEIPNDGTLLVSSDIADPAQDFRRPANGALLTAYGGHRFFVSDLRYMYEVRRDAPQRLHELRSFFGSDWSHWHDVWLEQNGITHVLVHDRCRPVWLGSPGVPLQTVVSRGSWTAFKVRRDPRPSVASETPAWVDMTPAFGQAECLLLRQRPSSAD